MKRLGAKVVEIIEQFLVSSFIEEQASEIGKILSIIQIRTMKLRG